MGEVYGVMAGKCLECGEQIPDNTLECPNSGCEYERQFDQDQYNPLVACAYDAEDVSDGFLEQSWYQKGDVGKKGIDD